MNRTWENLEEMRRGIMLMLQGNEYFAWQYVRGEKAPYIPCYDLSQLEQNLEAIFAGSKTPGFYTSRSNSMTRSTGIDFDNHDGTHQWYKEAEYAYKSLCSKGDECWFLESSPSSYHVLLFYKDYIPLKEARLALKDYAPKGVEIFPKQDHLGINPKAKGNLLRFPGKHQLKGTWGRFIERSGRIEVSQSIEQPNKKWKTPSFRCNMEGLYARVTKGLEITSNGQRFNAMKRLGGRLKGRVGKDEAIWIYKKWHNRYSSKIETPFVEGLKEFLTWFDAADPCILEIPSYVTTEEEERKIANLPKLSNIKPEILKEVARLFFRVRNYAQSKGIQEPWLSCRTISEKLEISIPTASRYREACVKLGLVRVIKVGHTGMATTYLIK